MAAGKRGVSQKKIAKRHAMQKILYENIAAF